MAKTSNKIAYTIPAEAYRNLILVAAEDGTLPGPYMRKKSLEEAAKGVELREVIDKSKGKSNGKVVSKKK